MIGLGVWDPQIFWDWLNLRPDYLEVIKIPKTPALETKASL